MKPFALSDLPKRYQEQVVGALHPKTPPEAPPVPQKRTQERSEGITVQLPYPPSANAYWRSVVINGRLRVLVSREARDYKKRVAEISRLNGLEPFTGPVSLVLNFWRPRRIGDLDNSIKVTLDSLRGAAFVDDSQVVEIHARRGEDKMDPRVIVRVMPHR